MIRSLFFAIGLSAFLGGASLLFVASVIVKEQPDIPRLRVPDLLTRERSDGSREWAPPPWLPMTLLTAGGLTMLYSIALPRKE